MPRHAAGTVFQDGKPRIVEIRDIQVDAEFAPHMLYVRNADKPGFIGQFGSLLGEAGVNVATFALGRDKPGGDAICHVAVDEAISDELLAQDPRDPDGQAGETAAVLRRMQLFAALRAMVPRRKGAAMRDRQVRGLSRRRGRRLVRQFDRRMPASSPRPKRSRPCASG